MTVIPYIKELSISFWKWEYDYDWNKINLPLPDNSSLATMMAIGYYVIWKIQNSHPDYYKQSIKNYIEWMNKTEFWKWLKVIVE